jgi:hypothetical protein
MSGDERDPERSADLTEAQAQRLADYSAGRLAPQERAAVEREILASPAMSAALYEDAGIEAMLAEEIAQTEAGGAAASKAVPFDDGRAPSSPVLPLDAAARRRGARRWWNARVALPVAAALLLALLTPQILRRAEQGRDVGAGDDFRFRSARPGTAGSAGAPGAAGSGDSESAPRALQPAGEIAAAPAQFVWTRDAGADAYRVEVIAANGRVLFSRTTADTSLAIAAGELPLAPRDSASWRVVPLAGGVARPASGLVRFAIAR